MNKEELKKLAGNPKYISGIYNYCDRWCERCLFTARCLNYAMDEQDMDKPQNYDLNSDAFWKKIHRSFQLAMELLQEMAEKEGIDLDEVEADDFIMEEEERQHDEAKQHLLSRSAFKYTKIVDHWFKENRPLFEQREKEMNIELELGLDIVNLDNEATVITDALDVIGWYQHQIYVKIMRALQQDDSNKFAEEHGFPKDSDGSAKVTLIGIDRSIGAWCRLREHFPEKADEILDILVYLERLRKSTEKEFPDARAFVRPGFDTFTSPETE